MGSGGEDGQRPQRWEQGAKIRVVGEVWRPTSGSSQEKSVPTPVELAPAHPQPSQKSKTASFLKASDS